MPAERTVTLKSRSGRVAIVTEEWLPEDVVAQCHTLEALRSTPGQRQLHFSRAELQHWLTEHIGRPQCDDAAVDEQWDYAFSKLAVSAYFGDRETAGTAAESVAKQCLRTNWDTADSHAAQSTLLALPTHRKIDICAAVLERRPFSELLQRLPFALHEPLVRALLAGTEAGADLRLHSAGRRESRIVSKRIDPIIVPQLCAQLARVPELAALDLADQKLGCASVAQLCEAVQGTKLTQINLRGNEGGAFSLRAALQLLPHWPGLRDVDLSSDVIPDHDSHEPINLAPHGLAQAVTQLTALTRLWLGSRIVCEDTFLHALPALAAHLLELHPGCTDDPRCDSAARPAVWWTVLECIGKLTQLMRVDLSDVLFYRSGPSFADQMQPLAACTALRHLRGGSSRRSVLATGLPLLETAAFANLQRLEITPEWHASYLHEEGSRWGWAGLAQLSALTYVSLVPAPTDEVRMDDADHRDIGTVRAVCDALAACTQLRELHMAGSCDAVKAAQFAAVCAHTTGLTKLSLPIAHDSSALPQLPGLVELALYVSGMADTIEDVESRSFSWLAVQLAPLTQVSVLSLRNADLECGGFFGLLPAAALAAATQMSALCELRVHGARLTGAAAAVDNVQPAWPIGHHIRTVAFEECCMSNAFMRHLKLGRICDASFKGCVWENGDADGQAEQAAPHLFADLGSRNFRFLMQLELPADLVSPEQAQHLLASIGSQRQARRVVFSVHDAYDAACKSRHNELRAIVRDFNAKEYEKSQHVCEVV